jgi:phage gpG-like protein
MINIEIQGKLPQVNTNFESVMEKITDIMYRSVQMNFIAGGRPQPWKSLQPFGESSHLMRSGNMFENIQLKWDASSATVYLDTARVPYAAINNFGGTIQHPGSDKFQAFDRGGEMIFTHGTQPHAINIPARPFMMFQEEDKTRILEIMRSSIFTTSQQENV